MGVSPPSAGGDSSTGGVSSGLPVASTTQAGVPVIALNGNNPANLNVGDTYGDLGALITGPTEADKNLGLQASLDGGATTTPEQIIIDTSTAGTHTILFSATNQAGNTGYAERTVNVLAPLSIVADVASTTAPADSAAVSDAAAATTTTVAATTP